MAEHRLIEPDLDFIREVKQAGGDTLKKCYQCATCSVVCDLSPADNPFPRKEMILSGWGQTDELVRDPDLWLCYQCNDCTARCPREAKPGDVLAAIRSWVYRKYSFPSFMGKAMITPAALPLLIGIPALILLACILMFAPTNPDGSYVFTTSEVVDFDLFLPHSAVDAIFVLGNIIIFAFAAIGFNRFWKALQTRGDTKLVGFVPAAISTVKEVLSHSRFRKCDANAGRNVGHMMLVYGFLGAMVTTGCVLVFVFIPHYLNMLGMESLHSWFAVPIDLPHPVKFLGAFSGIALVVGGALLIMRHRTDPEQVGANGYPDNFFIAIIFLTGLTGMLSWILRVSTLAWPAYIMYFLHLVGVWMLLWYMPYSKFAHMIYRTLALTYATMVGRTARTEMKQAA